MKQKTHATLFILLSSFLVCFLLIFNIYNYQREKNIIYNDLKYNKDNLEIESIRYIDHDVYTVILDDNKITDIYNHGNETKDFDVKKIASDILKKNNLNKIVVGNLYTNKYSYNFRYKNSITIINTKDTNKRLMTMLLLSIIIFTLGEAGIFYLTKNITKWVTKPLKDSNLKQNKLINDATHELKEPLDIIVAASNELIKDNKNKKQINSIRFEAERMSRLLNKFTELSKLDNKLPKESLKDENLTKIIDNCCQRYEESALEKQIQISKKLDQNVVFKCHRIEIEKLISILVDNAIKHCTKKSTITVKLNRDKNDIIIRISNPGSPIKPGDENKIFEQFYRSNEEGNRSNNRYGLKLVLAKNIVTNHNGTINAYSGDGLTTFKVVFKK